MRMEGDEIWRLTFPTSGLKASFKVQTVYAQLWNQDTALVSNQNSSVSNLQRAVGWETFAGEKHVFVQPVESQISECDHS